MAKKLLICLTLAVLLVSCKSGRETERSSETLPPATEAYDDSFVISGDMINDIIYSFAAIIEIPAFLKSLGVPYSDEYLAATGTVYNYNDNYKRAFILGVLGTDLGYMNMYSSSESLPDYVATIMLLADSISVGQFFDFSRLQGSYSSPAAADSMLFISMHGFNMADQKLREESRAQLSASMVAGVWVEGLYLLTRAAVAMPDEELFERIGEQKIILNDLYIILRNYERIQPGIRGLANELASMKKEFDDVSIIYEIGEPEAVERDGMLMIVQQEYSTVDITREQVQSITEKAETIRNELIL